MAEASLDYREPEWVAEKLGLDKNTVYKYLQEGWLPGVQLGRKWLISERILAEFLERETYAQMQTRRKSNLPQTPRLKKALDLATKYAIGRGQDFTGTEHLLVGIVLERDNFGAMILKNLGVDLDKPKEIFESLVPAQKVKVREAALTDRSQQVLRYALEQAIALGHVYIGCEALLLGILLESNGMGYKILTDLGVTYDAARAELLRLSRSRA
jgi:excisionase family DNA binding protein